MTRNLSETILVCLMIGLVIFSIAYQRLNASRISWKQATATVLMSQIVKHPDDSYRVGLIVQYPVRKRTYTERQYISGPSTAKSRHYSRLISGYAREGQKVEIVYNQHKPSEWQLKLSFAAKDG